MSFQAMIRSGYLKKFLLPGSVCAAVVKAATDQDFACDPKTGQLIRRSDLPIYSSDICESREDKDVEQSGLEQRISVVRKELWVWYDQYKGYRQKVVEVIDTGKAHTQQFIDQLRKEELPVPRSGAVALSGLAGFVLGLRGGWPRRILYGSVCCAAMAAVCYPTEASDFTKDALSLTKKYVTITYNFIHGVKPDSFNLPHASKLLGGEVEDVPKPKVASPAVVEEQKVGESPEGAERPTIRDQSNPADQDLYTNRR